MTQKYAHFHLMAVCMLLVGSIALLGSVSPDDEELKQCYTLEENCMDLANLRSKYGQPIIENDFDLQAPNSKDRNIRLPSSFPASLIEIPKDSVLLAAEILETANETSWSIVFSSLLNSDDLMRNLAKRLRANDLTVTVRQQSSKVAE
jgi:hypothetical protein